MATWMYNDGDGIFLLNNMIPSNYNSNIFPNIVYKSNLCLGIGLSNPEFNLDVLGSIHASSNLNIDKIANIGPNLNLASSLQINSSGSWTYNEGGSNAIIICDSSNSKQYLYMGADSVAQKSYIQSVGNFNVQGLLLQARGGNVGICHSSPSQNYALDINGSVNINKNLNLNNKLLVLWDNNSNDSVVTSCNFYGMGIKSGILSYQVPYTGVHAFYNGPNSVLTLDYQGNLNISGNITATNITTLSNNITNLSNNINTLSNNSYTYINNNITYINNNITALSNSINLLAIVDQPIPYFQKCDWMFYTYFTNNGFYPISTGGCLNQFAGFFYQDNSSSVVCSNTRIIVEGYLSNNVGSTTTFSFDYSSNFNYVNYHNSNANFTPLSGYPTATLNTYSVGLIQQATSPWFSYPSSLLNNTTIPITIGFNYSNSQSYPFNLTGLYFQYK
jgi:hypothetical protein